MNQAVLVSPSRKQTKRTRTSLGKMSYQQFLRALEETTFVMVWRKRSRQIRTLKDRHCPITAVAEFLTGKTFYVTDYLKAARIIGLPSSLAAQIVSAADASITMKQDIRKDLLRALNLQKPVKKPAPIDKRW